MVKEAAVNWNILDRQISFQPYVDYFVTSTGSKQKHNNLKILHRMQFIDYKEHMVINYY